MILTYNERYTPPRGRDPPPHAEIIGEKEEGCEGEGGNGSGEISKDI